MACAVEYTVFSWLAKIEDSSRRRLTERSTTVTSARRPTAISAAWVPDTPPPRIDDLGGRHAGHAAEQHAESAVGLLQAIGAHLHRHAARDFAHGREQRQRPVRRGHGLIGDGGGAGGHQRLGLFAVGRQVQIGEQRLSGAQQFAFGQLRLLDLDDEIGGARRRRPRAARCRAGGLIVRIVETDARAGAALHQHLVSGVDEFAHPGGHQTDPILMNLDLFGDADFHGMTPRVDMLVGQTITPRRAALENCKNALAGVIWQNLLTNRQIAQ